uniref:Uncharacterized protein n=1 Tax=Cacopsylla melanoneura TaxID=428564 RepID=A0A8D8X949_9HEMI
MFQINIYTYSKSLYLLFSPHAGLVIEPLLPSERKTFLGKIYNRKQPSRIHPFNIWTPNFIDVSETLGVYLTVYVCQVCVLVVVCVHTFLVNSLQVSGVFAGGGGSKGSGRTNPPKFWEILYKTPKNLELLVEIFKGQF